MTLGDETQAVLGGTRLHHHDVDFPLVVASTGDRQLEHASFEILVGRVDDPLTVLESEHDSTNGTHERDAADHQRCGCSVERDDVVWVLPVDRQDRRNDLCLTAKTIGERRPQRAIDEPAGQDRLLGRTAFTTEERSGDLSRCVHALFYIDGEGKEVDSLPKALVGGGGDQNGGVASLYGHRTVCLTSEFAGSDDDLAAAY